MIVNVMLNIIIIVFLKYFFIYLFIYFFHVNLKYYLGNFFYNQHPNFFLFFLGTLAPKLYISISPMIIIIIFFQIGQNRLPPSNHPPAYYHPILLAWNYQILRACLVFLFEQQFPHFKHTYTYFHTIFHPHIFQKTTKISCQITLSNTPQRC